MILIAPDKFKGTLSARQACSVIASAIRDCKLPVPEIVRAPMADGGEGTAEVLCSSYEWQRHDCYYVNRYTRTAVIDSSAVIGLQTIDRDHHDILKASSAPLGLKVREILKGGCRQVVIGVGGTATCDGGMGFIEALGAEHLVTYRHALIGLCDVRVPLVAPGTQPSALMFTRQKGATEFDDQVLRRRLTAIYTEYPGKRSPWDGAGGGLGFAIASVIGAECHDGAKYVLDHYNIDWDKIDMVITGEGRIDDQTSQGKVVSVVSAEAARHGIPVVAFGGTVTPGLESPTVISTDRYYPDLPLNEKTAALRLEAAVRDYFRD